MVRFFARFFLFYIATLILWFFIHSYYETILWFFTVKASQIFGPLTFTEPEIINGKYTYQLGNATFCYYSTQAITLTIFITIPLLLSTSGISLLNKVKMTWIGLALLFLSHSFFLLIALYDDFYRGYPSLIQKGMRIDQIITYNPWKAEMFSWLHHLFNRTIKFAVAGGIWIGLASYYKRSDRQHWIRKLF